MSQGSVAIYDREGKQQLGLIEVAKEIGHLGHQHPHDAIILPGGDVVVCCWSGASDGQGPAMGTISYWSLKRAGASKDAVIYA